MLKMILAIFIPLIYFNTNLELNNNLIQKNNNGNIDSIRLTRLEDKKQVIVTEQEKINQIASYLDCKENRIIKFLPKYSIEVFYNDGRTLNLAISWKNARYNGKTYRLKKNIEHVIETYY